MTRMLDALRQIDDHSVFPIPLAGDVPALAPAIVIAPAIPEESCSPTADPEPDPAPVTTDVGAKKCPEPLPEANVEAPEDVCPEKVPDTFSPSTFSRSEPDAWDCPPEWSAVAEKILEDFPPGRPGVLWFASPEPASHVAPAVASLAAALACQVTGEILAVDGNLRPPGLLLGHEEALTPDAARWGAALSELRRAYQLVLIDGSAADDFETGQAVRLADAVYLVIVLGRTGRRAARQAVAALRAAGGRVLGCIVIPAIE
jgi:hypothetical protein